MSSPLRTLSYAVTRADALPWAMLSHRLGWREKFRLLVVVGVAGLLAGVVPRDLDPVAWWALVGVILALGAASAILWTNLDVRRRAAALPLPSGAVTLQQWDDHICEHHPHGRRIVPYDTVTRVVRSVGHVFIEADGVPVIVPRAAFPTEDDMQDFAADIEARRRP